MIDKEIISKTTIKNWEKFNVDIDERLTKRANKKKSKKIFIPLERCSNKNTERCIKNIINLTTENNYSISSVMFSLCLNFLQKIFSKNIYCYDKFLNEYSHLNIIDDFISLDIPEEFDILGTIYQSLMTEGEKNVNGSYYTPKCIIEKIIDDNYIFENLKILDPCCGSGSFLLCMNNIKPENIYGCDIDAISVMICKTNLLCKFKNKDYYPNIKCCNFLNTTFNKKFDFIATNPPWGASNTNEVIEPIVSNETSSMFFVKSFNLLNENGILLFLVPSSLLNVTVHKDIRKFILDNTCFEKIIAFSNLFSNVLTDCVCLCCSNKEKQNTVIFDNCKDKKTIKTNNFYKTDSYTFTLFEDIDKKILEKIKLKGELTLKDSIWALGIVTGDNKNKLHDIPLSNKEEVIYTGKEINPYKLLLPKKYILYDRNSFQQVAKDEYYRCKEKLVYKFISKKLIFAYDDKGSLFLNSANILIPKIEGMSIKTVMAFLNSTIFQYLYIKLFNEIKILKNNLLKLPFPFITKKEDDEIISLINEVLCTNDKNKIDDYMYKFYNLSDEEIKHIIKITK